MKVRFSSRRGMVALASIGILAASTALAAPAVADTPFNHPMPGGHWTFVRSDAFLHYACKIPMSGRFGPVYRVRTMSWYNGANEALDASIGVYVATTRGRNSNVIDEESNPNWLFGFNGNEVWASAWFEDRLWVQGAYYGPPKPWTDGVAVRTLVTC